MRVTTAFKHLLRLPGVNVRAVAFDQDRVIVTVALSWSTELNNLAAVGW